MNKIKFLKLFDKIFGTLILSLIPSYKKNNIKIPEKIKNILLIRPGGIGDFLLLIPAIKILRSQFPNAKIEVLCEKRNSEVAAIIPYIDRVYMYDKGLDIFDCLKNSYDIIIDTEQWHRLSAFIAYLIKAPVKIGFDTNERGKVFNFRILYSHDDYEVHSFFHLLEPLIKIKSDFLEKNPFIDVSGGFPSELLHIPEIMRSKIISIFPGASVAERIWGADKFGAVAKTFGERGYKIVLIGSKKEKKNADMIKKIAPDSLDLTQAKMSLKKTAEILKTSRLLLTGDTGIMHLAYAVGTPVVSLFGAGIEKKWAPRGADNITINKHISCSPCTKFGYTPRCKIDIQCLSFITTDEVIAAMESILDRDIKR